MMDINAVILKQLIDSHISDFNRLGIERLQSITLDEVLNTNPYLLFHTSQMSAATLVSYLFDTHLRTYEEEAFKTLVANLALLMKEGDVDDKNATVDPNFFRKNVIDPFVYTQGEYGDAFLNQKCQIRNRLHKEFMNRFYDDDGEIDWPKLLYHTSGNYDLDKFISQSPISNL